MCRPAIIDAVFKAFEPFERYGFNKAHATCYGLIAYQTAYLKANYTVEYMTSVLTAVRDTAEQGGRGRSPSAAGWASRCGRPTSTARGLDFTVEGEAIRFGLLAIKNVGQGAIESIVAARTDGGPFRSLADLCDRVDLRLVNRRVLESLIKVGALDRLGHPAQLLVALDDALAAGQAAQRDRLTGQVSLFDTGGRRRRRWSGRCPPASRRRRRASGCAGRRSCWACTCRTTRWASWPGRSAEFVNAYSGELGEELDQQRIVRRRRRHRVRRSSPSRASTMGVATLEDLQGTMEVIVFPKVFEQTRADWAEDAILLVAGRVDHKGE